LGYAPKNKQKFYKNLFVKEFCSKSSFTTCNSCGRNGHIADVCPMKKTIHKKNYKGSNSKVVNNWPWYPNKIVDLKLTFTDPRKCGYQKELLDLFCRYALSHMGARTNGSWTAPTQDI
jgi:hypothetical protein